MVSLSLSPFQLISDAHVPDCLIISYDLISTGLSHGAQPAKAVNKSAVRRSPSAVKDKAKMNGIDAKPSKLRQQTDH